ncbi:MAG: hypothetical protein M3P08_16695 [Thermoproteota archaeon]|nr:hypothetical protein [Thermoproteota archaeon]
MIFLSVAISTLLFSVLVLVCASYAPLINAQQKTNSSSSLQTKLQNYTNATYGIKIQYPSRWSLEEGKNAVNNTTVHIADISPPIASDPNATVSLSVYVDTKPTSNNSVNQYVRDVIDGYRVKDSTDFKPHFRVIVANANNSILGGHPAYLLVYSWSNDGIGPTKSMETGTLAGDRVYYLIFDSELSKYSRFLPVVKQMISSFRFTNQLAVERANVSNATRS